MRQASILALAVATLAGALPCLAAEQVVVRTAAVPGQALVGQRVILRIEVLGKDAWAQVARHENFDVEGVFIMKTQSQGIRIQETIGGDSYTGQRYELSLYPQRAGTIEVPPVAADVSISSWGASAGKADQEVTLPGLSIEVSSPPGAEGIAGIISTTALSVEQKWDPQIDSVKAGEAIQRHLVFTASNVPGMAFLPMEHPEIPGVSTYPKEPGIEDKSARGELTGQRLESVTYVFESPGEVTLPSVDVYWWDLTAELLRHIELPGLTVQVEGISPAALIAPVDAAPAAGWGSLLVVCGSALGLVVLGYAFRHALFRMWKQWMLRKRSTEGYQFRAVLQAIETGNGVSIVRELMHWIDRLEEGDPARLDRFLEQYADSQTCRLTLQLATMAGREMDASLLRQGLKAARKRWKTAQRLKIRRKTASNQLPALN
jgi:hypothetical protein